MKRNMRNRIIELEIERLDEKGRGVGKFNNKEIKVYFAVPGDKIKAKLYYRKGLRGEIFEILEESKLRTKPKCKYFGRCGGCKWQNIRYKEQLKIKQEIAENLFENSKEVIPAKSEFHYRNRMDFVYWKDFKLGLREPERYNKVIDIDECLLISKECNKLLSEAREFLKEEKIEPYNIKTRRGLLRYVILREGKFTKDRMIIFLTSESEFPEIFKFKPQLNSEIIWSKTSSLADISYGESYEVVKGKSYIEEKLCGFRFRIYPNVFFQTNSEQAEVLFKKILEICDLNSKLKVLDLYCGTGVIGIILAEHVREVIGVEANKEAVEAAKLNAKENGVKNIKFIAAKAEDLSLKEKFDLVIVDPPRPGLGKRVIKLLKEISPREICYVSCNPYSQKRDIDLLRDHYSIEEVQPIDMFPHTPHLENIVVLRKI